MEISVSAHMPTYGDLSLCPFYDICRVEARPLYLPMPIYEVLSLMPIWRSLYLPICPYMEFSVLCPYTEISVGVEARPGTAVMSQ